MSVVELVPVVQNYAWGISGSSATVADLYHANNGGSPRADQPYAELWMGSHPSGPNKVKGTDQLFLEYLQQHEASLGVASLTKFGKDLPFLFKVLSVAKAHPDKELAAKLHKEQPEAYKDANHKPEMALAVSKFEALCSFREISEILGFLKSTPELRVAVGEDVASMFEKESTTKSNSKESLKKLYSSLMRRETSIISECISTLVARYSIIKEKNEIEELVVRLNKEYPLDVGILSVFMLNYLKLNIGEAIYLAANEPHAYLSGECIECMASSDNVVRAGLTPKYKDVNNLVNMLTYNTGIPQKLNPINIDNYSVNYIPPIDEFMLRRSILPANTKNYIFPKLSGPSLLLVFSGNTKINDTLVLNKGSVVYLPSDTSIVISNENTSENLELYTCSTNL